MAKFTFATEEGGFDNHIAHSIRGYQDLNKDILKFSEYFIEDDCCVLDIGCSTGRLLKEMQTINQKFASNCKYYGIEMELGFSDHLTSNKNLKFFQMDVRKFDWDKELTNCCLVTSIFTLQFLPKKDRLDIIRNIYLALNKGSAFIFSEKIHCGNSHIEEMITFCYYDWKSQYFSSKEILEKERTLRSMLKLQTYDEILSMLSLAGFENVQVFWQNFNFIGIIAIKS